MKIGFLGAGKMAGAIARGILASGLCRPDELAASDHHRSTLSKLAADTGLRQSRRRAWQGAVAQTLAGLAAGVAGDPAG